MTAGGIDAHVSGGPPASARLDIDRRLQLALAAAGSAALCIYWQSWKDTAHLLYDIPAAALFCGFLSQIVCEGASRQFTAWWWARVAVLAPMSVIPCGREFLGWPISGHLADLLAVALIQSRDLRLGSRERIAYWLALPIILWIRWFLFDTNGHWETYNALIAGVAIFLCCLAISKILENSLFTAGEAPASAQGPPGTAGRKAPDPTDERDA